MKQVFLLACSFCLLIVTNAQKHQLVKKWETDSVFKVPESVLYDPDHRVLYVSNIDGKQPWEKDGMGSIGKMGLDGQVINAEWITGFNAPKGMGLYHHTLYVADVDRVAIVDLHSGKIAGWIEVPGSQALNDLTIDANGVMYVSDSRGKKVYRIMNGVPEVYLENLKGPNGVLMKASDLYVLDQGGMYKVNADKSLALITDGMEGGTDGIVNISGNDFVVSCWAGVIWYVNADGSKEKLLDTREQKINTADIGFDPVTKTIFVPTFWKNSVVAYEVK
ncbi:MAG: ATP/GTP-binding protein [Chitinophagaceae bacterium]|nr:ATP/GTP-binding protein [Chitinophagaceae bacterium]